MGMIHDLHHGMNRSGFGIVRAVHEAFDPSVNHCASTHRARFNCNKQIAVSQAMVTNGCTSLAHRDDFGVGGRIGIRDVAIPSPADDGPVADNDCTYRDFFHFQSALGATEGLFHPEFVATVIGPLASLRAGGEGL